MAYARKGLGVIALSALLAYGCGVSGEQDSGVSKEKTGTNAAQPIFSSMCQPCHGSQGKGDGPAAAALPNKPADLTSDATQKKSDTDLENIIRDGRQEKGMPPWKSLAAKDIKNLVLYIRYLGGK